MGLAALNRLNEDVVVLANFNHAFGRRFNPASIRRATAVDRVTPFFSAHASIASITFCGTRPDTAGSRPPANGLPGFFTGGFVGRILVDLFH
jgi:hypothetical protein